MNRNRKERRQKGVETVEIIERGGYALDGLQLDLSSRIDAAVAGTVEYTNRDDSPRFASAGHDTRFEVINDTTLAAARVLVEDGYDTAALNFASAKNPGGGFLNGSLAQEESLAMSSALYACLVGREMYEYHRPTRGGMYTNWAIYSPRVPVIRDEEGELLAQTWDLSFITSPAPNAGVVLKREPERRDELLDEFEARIHKVLAIAAYYEHDAVVLGAWGCGVFGNDPATVAGLFGAALEGPFRGAFRRVSFAVLDWSHEKRFIGPFERRFGR